MSRVSARSLAIVLAAVPAVSGARAGIIFVDDSATGPAHNGTSWCSAFLELQDALAAAQPGDEIRVATGLYRPDQGSGDRLATFRLQSGVSLLGGYAGCGAPNPAARNVSLYETALDGDLNNNDGPNFTNYADNSYHVVTYDNPTATGVVLDGFIIRRGNADGPDGLTNQGGGIHIRNGLAKCLPGGPTIRNCTVEKNWGAHHGAINDHGLSTRIENCTIRDNYSAEEGGGLQVHSGAPTITNCVFLNNESAGDGGGAWVGVDTDPTCSGASLPIFENCTFSGNRAIRGGGLFNNGAVAVLTGSDFSSNIASADDIEERRGGGLYNAAGSTATLVGCIFNGNSAHFGSGLYNDGDVDLTLTDCTLQSNGQSRISNRFGGALYAGMGCAIQVTRCVFNANISYYSALYVESSSFLAEDCTFSNNVGNYGMLFSGTSTGFKNCVFEFNSVPDHRGGALYANFGSHDFANCRFEGNHANEQGGAASFNGAANARFANCLFLGNSAATGGAISVAHNSWVEVLNSTLVNNTAAVAGASVSMMEPSPSPTLRVYNSILWDAGGVIDNSVGGSVTIAASDVLGGWAGSGNINTNPLLQADFRLSPGSPCIDAGNNANLPFDLTDLDLDGNILEPLPLDAAWNTRIVGASVDMGAYEANGSGPAICLPGTFSATGVAPCTPCTPGFAQPNWSSTHCVACVPGTYQPQSGATACTVCSPGFAQPNLGATSCPPCAPGAATPLPGALLCTGCPPGTYQPAPGSASCLACNCDDGVPCTIDLACNAVSGVCGHTPNDALCDTGLFCSAQRCDMDLGCVFEHECISANGDPCPTAGSCEESADTCGGCMEPVMVGAGSRYLSVTPGTQGNTPVAIKILGDCSDAEVGCVASYVQSTCEGGSNNGLDCLSDADCPKWCVGGANPGAVCIIASDCPLGACVGRCDTGTLGATPFYKSAAQWGTVKVRGAQVRPETKYRAHMECNFAGGVVLSSAASATTWRWGDIDHDGDIDAIDISILVSAFKGIGGSFTFEQLNLHGCVPDDVINALDIALDVNAFKGFDFPCPLDCP